MIKINCPYCNNTETELIDESNQEVTDNSYFIERHWNCEKCNQDFWTQQTYKLQLTHTVIYNKDYEKLYSTVK